jgi:hypothetical protein
MLKRLMMRMRSDFGLPIGTKHAHHQPKRLTADEKRGDGDIAPFYWKRSRNGIA